MRIATPQELAGFLRTHRQALLADWEAEVRRLPRERALARPVLLDDVPLLLDQLIHDLELLAMSESTVNVSRLHGEQRQTARVGIRHIVEEYKLLRSCIVDAAERAGWVIAGPAGRLLNSMIDEIIKASIDSYVKQRDQEERSRREEYVSFIVHDLRAPLTSVYYAVLLLERRLEKLCADDTDLALPASVKRNIEHMQALIVQLLQAEQNLALGSELDAVRAPVQLHALVQAAMETLAPLARKKRTTVVNEVGAEVVIHGDPDLLGRALQNLVANAIEHSPRGNVTITAAIEGTAVECRVCDDGEGIAEDEIAKVFDKFHTGRRRNGGVGLGLAVVKRVAEAHGGRVHLESRAGQGTTVRLVLADALAAAAAAEAGGGKTPV